jgi:large repetitive protein
MIRLRRNFSLQFATVMAAALLVTACSNDDSSTASTNTAGSGAASAGNPSANTDTLTLQGTPPTTVVAQANYYFQPKRSVSSSMVTFKVTGLPSWARFDSSTGALSGIPQTRDEGTTGHIVISASNDTTSAAMTPFVIKVTAPVSDSSASGAVLLSWQPPTENVDGSPVSNLAGYHIYYGKTADDLTSTVTVSGADTTSYVVKGLEEGAYYFSVVAFNSAGMVSGKSNLADQTVGS